MRTDVAYAREVHAAALEEHRQDIEARRAGELVSGIFCDFRVVRLFTDDEVVALYAKGLSVPFDLMPSSWWWPPSSPFPRFGEEALGDSF